MTEAFRYPPKPVRGDRIAVLSPSSRAPALFPAVYELGLERLCALGLEPVEYPTTRAREASPAERARDVHAAFADPDVKAVLASIGGDDQLKVLAHLDPEALAASPKPFFGYSDNTNLHLVLWNLGIVSFHGGSVLVQLGRPGSMHPATQASLERALFESGRFTLEQPAETGDEEQDWSEPDRAEPALEPAEPWSWHGPETAVTGRTWGGNLEILDFHLRVGRYLPPDERLDGCVLVLETSEELPPAGWVYRVLMTMGERGLLQRFGAVLWGRPKAWARDHRNAPAEKRRYVEEQREAVLRAVAEYHPEAPLVFGVDFGHTDPQLVLPYGGEATVDATARRIEVVY